MFPAFSPLILASASPRRADILRTLRLPFVVRASAFDEPTPSPHHHAAPFPFVETLAQHKVAHCEYSESDFAPAKSGKLFLLGADTIVWHDGAILGKPTNAADALHMLHRLRGETHQVISGVCLRTIEYSEKGAITDERFAAASAHTQVTFRALSDAFLERYIAGGEPMDKAGSYAAQGEGMMMVERIEGDFWNVVGLPLEPLLTLLNDEGAPPEMWRAFASTHER